MVKSNAGLSRRRAFDMMEQALKLLDESDEYQAAALLDHAIAVLAMRPTEQKRVIDQE